ncbi:hypothetical protein [Empedobacter falsenii]|uniref:hypothetical protein n=1 Tax=Empedobacter falsenii TaxID=343874 RepID=UPI0025755A84|nr:hypothetical protein [Empedobacter falsenii]
MWYKINFDKLVVMLLPTYLRKPRMIAFITLFSAELTKLYNAWLVKKIEDEKWLYHNSQVCKLRKILNDEFDDLQRRIIITDGQLYERKYIYTLGEKKPVKLGKIYIRQASDYADTGIDFFVIVPVEINIKQNKYKLEALINRYRLASKRYKIIYNG